MISGVRKAKVSESCWGLGFSGLGCRVSEEFAGAFQGYYGIWWNSTESFSQLICPSNNIPPNPTLTIEAPLLYLEVHG